MTNDLLERTTRAFSSTTAESGPDPERLEQILRRVQAARGRAPNRRRTLRTLYWTLATLFVGVGAWANATGRVSWFRADPAPAATEASPTEHERAPRSAAPAETPPPLEVPPVEVAPPPVEVAPPPVEVAPPPVEVAPPRREVTPTLPAPKRPRAPLVPEAPAPRESSSDAYRAAHRTHFTERDYARALPAWDHYLAMAEPGHPLLPEARFNRAIALYRLGEWLASREALEPFARGDYGGYRRDEARRLLEALAREH